MNEKKHGIPIINLFRHGETRTKKHLKEMVPYDPETQIPIIRSSICTGEKVAGFKNKTDGHFTEVMLIRTPEELKRFQEAYGLEEVKTEY